ncbi:hypothetical protein BV22DRAFT_1048350 [Leucogyrophana mollusca]|uniref:Uncharacterized protein n=1 Tax=Leucogyrophana mollusca TaxID=85980 RepID=A0ACB8BCL9_9AGAM|nr:hypothetical protein BV22DRAFT_1048350 [Leucogyrophana mollusca]
MVLVWDDRIRAERPEADVALVPKHTATPRPIEALAVRQTNGDGRPRTVSALGEGRYHHSKDSATGMNHQGTQGPILFASSVTRTLDRWRTGKGVTERRGWQELDSESLDRTNARASLPPHSGAACAAEAGAVEIPTSPREKELAAGQLRGKLRSREYRRAGTRQYGRRISLGGSWGPREAPQSMRGPAVQASGPGTDTQARLAVTLAARKRQIRRTRKNEEEDSNRQALRRAKAGERDREHNDVDAAPYLNHNVIPCSFNVFVVTISSWRDVPFFVAYANIDVGITRQIVMGLSSGILWVSGT